MSKEKTERNKLIVDLIDKKKWSMSKVAKEMGFESKATVHEIYHREKAKKVRSELSPA